MELIIGILQFIGWVVTFIVVAICILFVRNFTKSLNDIRERNQLEQDKGQLGSSMLVYVEKIDKNLLHMYDKMSGLFVAQGNTEEELWERAELRCPDINLILAEKIDGNIIVKSSDIGE